MANDPREPLSPEEAALSRVYAALPRPEPAPALDAAVLAQARAALDPSKAQSTTPTRRRRRPWYLMPGTGLAAAAVLAAGISWQVGLLDDSGMDGVATQSAPAMAPDAAKPDAARRDSVDVEFLRREQAQRVEEALPQEAEAPAPARKQESKATPASRQRAAAPAPQALPPPRAPAEAVPEPAPVIAEDAASPPAPAAPGGAPLGNSAAQRQAYEQDDGATLDRVEVTGSRIQRLDVDLPPWSSDSSLPPDAWLERVRERVRNGDREGARSSLRRFTREHPALPVPEELTLLLVQ